MKKLLALILCLSALLSLCACGAQPTTEEASDPSGEYNTFMIDLSFENVKAVNARVEIDAEGSRVLMADIMNSSYTEVTEITLSFATWDKDGNFVVIKSKNTPDNTSSEFQMTLDGVTIPKNTIWSADRGIHLDPSCPEIAYVQAIVISAKKADEAWENEYYESFKRFYLDQPRTDWMKEIDDEKDTVKQVEAIRTALAAEPFFITKTQVFKNEADQEVFLCANLKNNSEKVITSFQIAFCAWNENGKPCFIKSVNTEVEDDFFKIGNMKEVTIGPGEEWIGCEKEDGSVVGISIDYSHIDLVYTECIVISVTTDDGETWENPHLSEWKSCFNSKYLENRMKVAQ